MSRHRSFPITSYLMSFLFLLFRQRVVVAQALLKEKLTTKHNRIIATAILPVFSLVGLAGFYASTAQADIFVVERTIGELSRIGDDASVTVLTIRRRRLPCLSIWASQVACIGITPP